MGKTVFRCQAVPWRHNERSCFHLHKQQSYQRYHATLHLLLIQKNLSSDQSFVVHDEIKELPPVYRQNAEHLLVFKIFLLRDYWTYGDSNHKFALFSFLRSLRGSQLPHRSTMGLQCRHILDVYCGHLICLHQRSGVGGHCKVQETPSSSKLDLGQSRHCWSWRDSFCQHY